MQEFIFMDSYSRTGGYLFAQKKAIKIKIYSRNGEYIYTYNSWNYGRLTHRKMWHQNRNWGGMMAF